MASFATRLIGSCGEDAIKHITTANVLVYLAWQPVVILRGLTRLVRFQPLQLSQVQGFINTTLSQFEHAVDNEHYDFDFCWTAKGDLHLKDSDGAATRVRGDWCLLNSSNILRNLVDHPNGTARTWSHDKFMKENFMSFASFESVRRRPHTLLGATFSHVTLDHIVGNMQALQVFGRVALRNLGPRKFAQLYVGGAYASGLMGCAFGGLRAFLTKKQIQSAYKIANEDIDQLFSELTDGKNRTGSLGASGAIAAVQAFAVLAEPKIVEEKNAQLWLSVYLIREFVGIFSNDGIGHDVHAGGAIFGAFMWCRSYKGPFMWLVNRLLSHEVIF